MEIIRIDSDTGINMPHLMTLKLDICSRFNHFI
jgi:hypothetical protein